MTKEEIDIVVEVKIQDLLKEFKKSLPSIKKQLSEIQNELHNIDIKKIKLNVNMSQVKKEVQKVKKQIKEAFKEANISDIGIKEKSANTRKTKENSKKAPKISKAIEEKTPIQETKQAENTPLTQSNSINKENEKNNKKGVFSSWFSEAKKMVTKLNETFKITSRIKNAIKGFGTGMKNGLGHIVKFAANLFSLQKIYGVLSGAAQSWLSSQNEDAKQLSTNIEYMKYAMGSALSPIIQFITNLVYQMMKAIQSVAYALTGVNIFAKASSKSYASMSKNAKKAKEETKQLAGIHSDINNISDNKSSDSGSESGTIMPSFDLSHLDNISSNIIEAIKNENWYEVGASVGEKLNETLEQIPWDSIQGKAGEIGTGLANTINGFVKKADWNLIGNTIAQGINTGIIFTNTFVKNLEYKEIGKSLSEGINSTIINIQWDTLAETISLSINGILEGALEFIKNIDTSTIANSIVEFLTNIDWLSIAGNIIELLINAILTAAIVLPIQIGMAIGEKIKEGIDGIVEQCKENGKNVMLGILEGIASFGDELGQWIIDHIFQPFIDAFKNIFGIHSPSTVMQEQGTFIMEGLLNGISSLVDRVTEIWNNIKVNTGLVIDNIKNGVKEKFTDVKNGVIEIFNGMKNSMSNIWNGIWNTIKGVINSILSGIEGMANGVVSGINTVIRALNKLQIDIPNWVPGYGGKKFGFNLSELNKVALPRLATGNVAYEETLAIFGEYSGAKNNPEITAPQNILRETFEDVLANQELNSDNNHDTGLKQLIIQFGSAKVALEMENLLQQARRENGIATVTM